MNEEWLISDCGSRTQNSMPESKWLALPYINAGHTFRHDVLDAVEQLCFTGIGQGPLEFVGLGVFTAALGRPRALCR